MNNVNRLVQIDPHPKRSDAELVTFEFSQNTGKPNVPVLSQESGTGPKPWWCPEGRHYIALNVCKEHPTHWVPETFNKKYLRLADGSWYDWPFCQTISTNGTLEKMYKSQRVYQLYGPDAKSNIEIKQESSPKKCVFCLKDLGTVSAHCLQCGSAMHLSCIRETGDKCIGMTCASNQDDSIYYQVTK